MNPVTRPHSRYINGRSVDSLHDNIEFQDPKLSRVCKDLPKICFKEDNNIIQGNFTFHPSCWVGKWQWGKYWRSTAFIAALRRFVAKHHGGDLQRQRWNPLVGEKNMVGGVFFFRQIWRKLANLQVILYILFLFWRSVRSVGVENSQKAVVIHQIRDRSWVSRWLKLEIPHTSECFVIDSWRKSATQKCRRLEGICDRSQESFSGSLLWQVLWDYILELYSIHLYTLVTWCVSSCSIFRSGFNNISGLSWERCWNKCRRSGCTGFDGWRLGE